MSPAGTRPADGSPDVSRPAKRVRRGGQPGSGGDGGDGGGGDAPALAAPPLDLDATLAAIRSVRDVEASLNSLRAALTSPGRAATAAALLTASPRLADLGYAWDAQLAAKHEGASVALLRAHAAALRAACEAGGGAAAGAGRAAAACASGRRTRLLYYNLASGARPRAAAALDWLATAAACGGDAAAALASGFDFGLPALGALARPPRGAGGGRPTDWGAADPARRPSAALVLAFGVDLLGACDGVALVGLLRQRPFFGLLLDHLGSAPAAVAARVVDAVAAAVRRADAPPATRSTPFGDAALTVLVGLTTLDEGDGASAAAMAAAAAARRLLTALATDSALGLAPPPPRGPGEWAAPPPPPPAGTARLGRCLARLRPLDRDAHFRVAAAVAAASPEAAAALFAACPLSAEPGEGGRWLAACALAAAAAATCAAATAPALAAAAAAGRPAPGPDTHAHRAVLRAAGLPFPLPRAALTRGVQAASPLARHAALAAVLALADGAAPLMAQLGSAADAALVGVAAGWRGLNGRVRAALRSCLPEPQALVSAHAACVTAAAAEGKAVVAKDAAGGDDDSGDGETAETRAGSPTQPSRSSLLGIGASAAALAAVLAALPAAALDARLDAGRLLPDGCEAWPAPVLRASLRACAAAEAAAPARPAAAAAALGPLLRVATLSPDAACARLAADAAGRAVAAAAGETGPVGATFVAALPRGDSDDATAARDALLAVVTSLAKRPLDAAAEAERLPAAATGAGPVAAVLVRRALGGAARGAASASAVCAYAAAAIPGAAYVRLGGAAWAPPVTALVAAVSAELGVLHGDDAAAPLLALAGAEREITSRSKRHKERAAAEGGPALDGSAPFASVVRALPSATPAALACSHTLRSLLISLAHAPGARAAAVSAAAVLECDTPPAAAVTGDLARRAAVRAPGVARATPLAAVAWMNGVPLAVTQAAAAAWADAMAWPDVGDVADGVLAGLAGGRPGAAGAAAAIMPRLPLAKAVPVMSAALQQHTSPACLRAAAALLDSAGGDAADAAQGVSTLCSTALTAASHALLHAPVSYRTAAAACASAALRAAQGRGVALLGADAAPTLDALLAAKGHHSPTLARAAAQMVREAASLADRAADVLPATLDAAGGPRTPARREAAAALMPVAAAVFEHAGTGVAREKLASLVDAYGGPVQGYVTAKPATVAASAPTAADLSPSAEAALRAHAAKMAGAIWCLNPPCGEEGHKLLARLAPSDGWPAHGAPPPAVAGAARPATRERLQAALAFVAVVGDADRERAAAAVAAAAAATLARLEHDTAKAGARAPPDAELADALWVALDGPLGDALGGLPPSSVVARARLVPAARSLTRHAVHSPTQRGLRRVRRLLAALLPTDDVDGEGGEDGDGADDAQASDARRALAELGGTAAIRVLASLAALGLGPGAQLPPLPAEVAALDTPLESVLAAADAAPASDAPCAASEAADLLDTALALERAYGAGGGQFAPGVAAARQALPSLLMAYGGTLGRRDRALFRCVASINVAAAVADGEEDGCHNSMDAACVAASHTHDHWAAAGFGCGLAAARAGATCSLRGDGAPDARRAALSVVHFPERRTLAGDDSDGDAEWEDGKGGVGAGVGGGAHTAPCSPVRWPRRHAMHHAAGLDPAWVVPMLDSALASGACTPGDAAACGALPLALRCLASADPALRWAAYSVAARAAAALEEGEAARRDRTDGESETEAGPGAGRAAPQLLLLLRVLRSTARAPGERLPALLAAFAAHAAAALCVPAGDAYAPANRALLRAPALAPGDVPLLKALGGGGAGARADRAGLLRLLAAGLRSPGDGDVFRKRFLPELLMALAGSPLAEPSAARYAATALTAAAAAAPGLAADLADRCGYVEWLAAECIAQAGAGAAEGQAGCLARSLNAADALARVGRHAAGRAAAGSAVPCGLALMVAARQVADALAGVGGRVDSAWLATAWLHALDLACRAPLAAGRSSISPCLTGEHVRAALEAFAGVGGRHGVDGHLAVVAAVAAQPPPVVALALAESKDVAGAALVALAVPTLHATVGMLHFGGAVSESFPSQSPHANPAEAEVGATRMLAWLARATRGLNLPALGGRDMVHAVARVVDALPPRVRHAVAPDAASAVAAALHPSLNAWGVPSQDMAADAGEHAFRDWRAALGVPTEAPSEDVSAAPPIPADTARLLRTVLPRLMALAGAGGPSAGPAALVGLAALVAADAGASAGAARLELDCWARGRSKLAAVAKIVVK